MSEQINNDFQNEIVSYWQRFKNTALNELMMAYDAKELQTNNIILSKNFYDDLERFCIALSQLPAKEEYLQETLGICKKLPTSIVMYMMQNLHQRNGGFFQKMYQKMSEEGQYQTLKSRCKSFEKNVTLARVFSELRVEIMGEIMDDLQREAL
ncbi:hypothetical protein [Fangia hongkongensis]|uniref:type IVB secretion system protein IcmW n=2 Tax=Fangia hongkongensis TaxID=270495 RepID=UPI000375A540|nr:hypothetical protein [Fangia hongkongensis]